MIISLLEEKSLYLESLKIGKSTIPKTLEVTIFSVLQLKYDPGSNIFDFSDVLKIPTLEDVCVESIKLD